MNSLWKFSRPHTIIGTSLSVFALYFIALFTTDSRISVMNLEQAILVWIACLCGNIYIVGLNQLSDIEIDKINKPSLPLASGEFSLKQGKLIVGITGIISIIISLLSGTWLLATVANSLFIGTIYSLPPIRLKQYPLLAAFCIFTVRGIIVNLGLFFHFSQKIIGHRSLNPYVWTLTFFIVLFTIAIAIFKDIPDREGDNLYKIKTFTIIFGKERVFNISLWIITVCYLGMIIARIIGLHYLNSNIFFIAHFILLILLWWRSQKVDLAEKQAIADFYQLIWKLFFLEYIIFPLCFI